jgi:hypothetical protein
LRARGSGERARFGDAPETTPPPPTTLKRTIAGSLYIRWTVAAWYTSSMRGVL